MTDGPRKSMTRDPSTDYERRRYPEYNPLPVPEEWCEECKTYYFIGDWPWCCGDREKHLR